MAIKAIDKTIKNPIIKIFSNTIKNPVGVFSRNKNNMKRIAYGLKKKQLQSRLNFGNQPVKHLGEDSIKNIYMRSAAQMNGKGLRSMAKRSVKYMRKTELGSMLNTVAKSKTLAFLSGGGLVGLAQFNLLSASNDVPKGGEPTRTNSEDKIPMNQKIMENPPFNRVIVTGGNKGIGYKIVEGILKLNLAKNVILCSRDRCRGEAAINELIKLNPEYEKKLDLGKVDLNSKASIKNFRDWVHSKYKTVDCIVNNAGFAYKDPDFNRQALEESFRPNFDNTLFFQKTMLDRMENNGKVLFIASRSGAVAFGNIKSKEILERFLDPKLDMDKILTQKKEMFNSIDKNTYNEDGWPIVNNDMFWNRKGYGLSKMYQMFAVESISNLPEYMDRNIQVYSVSPGYCNTDLAGYNSPGKTPEEGADTALWQMQKPKDIKPSEQGQLFHERKWQDWTASDYKDSFKYRTS